MVLILTPVTSVIFKQRFRKDQSARGCNVITERLLQLLPWQHFTKPL